MYSFFEGMFDRDIDRGMLEVESWRHLFCDFFSRGATAQPHVYSCQFLIYRTLSAHETTYSTC